MRFLSLISIKDWNDFNISINGCIPNKSKYNNSQYSPVMSFNSISQEHISWINYSSIALIDVQGISVTTSENDGLINVEVTSNDISGMVNAITDNDIEQVTNPVELTRIGKNIRMINLLKTFIKVSKGKIIVHRSPTGTNNSNVLLAIYRYAVPKYKERILFNLIDNIYASEIPFGQILIDHIDIDNGFINISVSDDLYHLISNNLMTPKQLEAIKPENVSKRMDKYFDRINSSKGADQYEDW